jgi:hypothetical protein
MNAVKTYDKTPVAMPEKVRGIPYLSSGNSVCLILHFPIFDLRKGLNSTK